MQGLQRATRHRPQPLSCRTQDRLRHRFAINCQRRFGCCYCLDALYGELQEALLVDRKSSRQVCGALYYTRSKEVGIGRFGLGTSSSSIDTQHFVRLQHGVSRTFALCTPLVWEILGVWLQLIMYKSSLSKTSKSVCCGRFREPASCTLHYVPHTSMSIRYKLGNVLLGISIYVL